MGVKNNDKVKVRKIKKVISLRESSDRSIFVGEFREAAPLAVEDVLVMGRKRRFDEVDRLREDAASLRLQQVRCLQLRTQEKPDRPNPLLRTQMDTPTWSTLTSK